MLMKVIAATNLKITRLKSKPYSPDENEQGAKSSVGIARSIDP